MSPFSRTATESLRVRSGHAAVFSFPPISSVPAPSVTWQSGDNAYLYGKKYAYPGDNSLIILSAGWEDAKKYRSVETRLSSAGGLAEYKKEGGKRGQCTPALQNSNIRLRRLVGCKIFRNSFCKPTRRVKNKTCELAAAGVLCVCPMGPLEC